MHYGNYNIFLFHFYRLLQTHANHRYSMEPNRILNVIFIETTKCKQKRNIDHPQMHYMHEKMRQTKIVEFRSVLEQLETNTIYSDVQ